METAAHNLASEALQILRSLGVAVTSGTAADWTLRLPDSRFRAVNVKTFVSPPSNGWLIKEVLGHPDRQMLAVVRSAPEHLKEYALEGVLDLVEVENGRAIISGKMWSKTANESIPAPTHKGKPAWGRWGVMRTLYLSGRPLSQTEIADVVGIRQPAVSQILRQQDFVERTKDGWVATNRDKLFDQWNLEYPGAGGLSTYWYGLQPVAQQAASAQKLLVELEIGQLASGDIAADEYAPWRLPALARLYVKEVVDFTVMGLTPSAPDEATLIATIPDDETIWRTAILGQKPKTMLADPLITYWDLLRENGSDAGEAAAILLGRLVDRAND